LDLSSLSVYPLDESAKPTITSQEPQQQSEQAAIANAVEKAEPKKSSKSGKDKEKGNKDSGKRSKFLGTLANKLGKHPSKTRETQEQKIDELRKQIEELDINNLQTRKCYLN